MDIVIIANFCRDFSKADNGRFTYIANKLALQNDVEIVTSDFHHGKKAHRDKITAQWPFKITFIHEPGYPKNVCLKRFYSHKILAKNLTRYLKNRKKPDVIYCAIPSLDFAEAACRHAKKNNIRFILDIQDLWPEAFKMVLNIPVISSLIFAPMKWQANRIYKSADHIVAVSETYADRAKRVNKTADTSAVFLGTEMNTFDSYMQDKPTYDSKIKIAYIGTLGHSYDVENVIRAIDTLPNKQQIKFIVMGDGPLKGRFEAFAKRFDLNIEFTGKLDYPQMVARLGECDIAVNPIVKGAAQSIINKVGDYAMAGIPVINTLECQEYRELIDEYGAGINCECENVDEIANAILTLCENEELRLKMGAGNRRMAAEKFDREKTYQQICKIIVNEG